MNHHNSTPTRSSLADTHSGCTVLYGSAIHSLSQESLQYLRQCLIGISPAGLIAFVHPDVEPHRVVDALSAHGSDWIGPQTQLIWLRDDEFCVPGLIDTHTHAAQ